MLYGRNLDYFLDSVHGENISYISSSVFLIFTLQMAELSINVKYDTPRGDIRIHPSSSSPLTVKRLPKRERKKGQCHVQPNMTHQEARKK